ncbi:hypothetical protein AOQ84DRAFT_246591, partial [Glonium stellatum]
PFLALPRELRDQIYDHVFNIPDNRSSHDLRIERPDIEHFSATPTSILAILHHGCILLNRSIAAEALEALFKKHTVFFSCGPYVLKETLSRISAGGNGEGKKWLSWMKRVEIDWVTLPIALRRPPPRRRRTPPWRQDYRPQIEEGDDYYMPDYEGSRDSEDYGDSDPDTYDPANGYIWQGQEPHDTSSSSNDPFGLSYHYPFSPDLSEDFFSDTPFADPLTDPPSYPYVFDNHHWNAHEALSRLEQTEIKPLFSFLSTGPLNLTRMTLPLYFPSRLNARWQTRFQRRAPEASAVSPDINYWVRVSIHGVLMLLKEPPALRELCIRYMPYNIWASLEPSDDLAEIEKNGLWGSEEGTGEERESLKAVLTGLAERGVQLKPEDVNVSLRLVKWTGEETHGGRIGDGLEVLM